MSAEEDPLSLKQIISRYESAEEEFLRELESMQANTDTSDEFGTDESPVLGTLCSLVTEISQLRRQNRKLRRRLVESSSTPSSRPSRPTSSVVQRMSTFLDASRLSLLPKFMSSSGSSQGINVVGSAKKPPSANVEVRSGARERLSSPPQQLIPKMRLQTNLAISSYSTDLSSDSSSMNRRRNTPPLVLPESSDSDADGNVLPDYEPIDDNCLSPCYPRRSLRRPHHGLDTSPSSMSAGSSIEPNDTMTSSRSSFLELIGIRRRQKSPDPSTSCGKKRRRKISENDAVRSTQTTTNSHVDKRLSVGTRITSKESLQSAISIAKEPTKHVVANSLKNLTNVSIEQVGIDETDNDFDSKLSKKIRPKSVAYLHPPRDIGFPPKSGRLRTKTKSWRSVASRASEDTNHSTYTVAADDELQLMQDENCMLRNEIKVLKTRNTQLIENLRDKSMQLSKTQHKMEIQQNDVKRKELMNDALDKLFLQERITKYTEDSLNVIENRLKEFESDLQATKNDALRNQQLVINSTFREQSAYQHCLEQVERLQRENFSLLQTKAGEFGIFDKQNLRDKLETLPRYDVLYAFAMRIVRKLGQLRTALVEKSNKLIRAELELMHQQSALLIAHTQLERLKSQPRSQLGNQRPASFHGDDLIDKLTKPHLNVFLPFQLHGSRIEQQRKAQANATENAAFDDDDGIEAEFLRFFDSTRFPTKSNGTTASTPEREKTHPQVQNVIVYRNGRGTVSPMNSPILQERRRFVNGKDSPLANRKERQIQISTDFDDEQPPQNRPCSWNNEPQDRRHPSTNVHIRQTAVDSVEVRRLAEDIASHRVSSTAENLHDFNGAINMTNASPVLRFSHRHESARAQMSSLQDINGSSNGFRSPSTTPILTRRIPLLGSPKFPDRRLQKQQSLQTSPNGSSYDNQPLYDSPPRASMNDSSDYGSIDSRPTAMNRRTSSDRRPPQLNSNPKSNVHFHYHHNHSRLPQPHAAANSLNYTPSTNSNGSSTSNGATALKRSNAILRRNSPVLSHDQRPSIMRQNALIGVRRPRQSASESPRLSARFQHTTNVTPNLSQTITEEEEQSQADSLNSPIHLNGSRLPKPSGRVHSPSNLNHAAKKARSFISHLINKM
ncbi:hypothetical protein M3Y95_00156900 [Aphelenchoides besseyi]|nr:hypothetical protein M3Y95_00156900 [Aphelenchoides besseyi]